MVRIVSSFAEFLPTLIRARTGRQLTQGHLAHQIGLAPSTIQSWEAGKRTPSRHNAQRWADALDVQLPDDTTGWFSMATRHRRPQHGTRTGAARLHREVGERPCDACRAAETAYSAGRRAARRA
jgi:transcriptional regulator with XRE-family HTH domain